MRPVLLDLFCGAGGAAVGYALAGFRVVGIDVNPQPNFPFTFIQGDAFRALEWLSLHSHPVVAIHASPPCQGYTTMNNRHGKGNTPRLIGKVRDQLQRLTLPYIIENVAGARSFMESPIRLTGEMFDLRVHRPRYFESNIVLVAPPSAPRQQDPIAVYGRCDQRRLWTRVDGTEHRAATLREGREGMGIWWMQWDELKEAIPPAYTEWVGRQLIQHIT